MEKPDWESYVRDEHESEMIGLSMEKSAPLIKRAISRPDLFPGSKAEYEESTSPGAHIINLNYSNDKAVSILHPFKADYELYCIFQEEEVTGCDLANGGFEALVNCTWRLDIDNGEGVLYTGLPVGRKNDRLKPLHFEALRFGPQHKDGSYFHGIELLDRRISDIASLLVEEAHDWPIYSNPEAQGLINEMKQFTQVEADSTFGNPIDVSNLGQVKLFFNEIYGLDLSRDYSGQ